MSRHDMLEFLLENTDNIAMDLDGLNDGELELLVEQERE